MEHLPPTAQAGADPAQALPSSNSSLAPAPAKDSLSGSADSGGRALAPLAPGDAPSLYSPRSHAPLSHSERIQHLATAARILREETLSELDALSRSLPPDQFCTLCCDLDKEITALKTFLLQAQLDLRFGRSVQSVPLITDH